MSEDGLLPTIGAKPDQIKEALEQKAPRDVEFRIRTKSGEYRWFWARTGAVLREGGGPPRMAGSTRDAHAHKVSHD